MCTPPAPALPPCSCWPPSISSGSSSATRSSITSRPPAWRCVVGGAGAALLAREWRAWASRGRCVHRQLTHPAPARPPIPPSAVLPRPLHHLRARAGVRRLGVSRRRRLLAVRTAAAWQRQRGGCVRLCCHRCTRGGETVSSPQCVMPQARATALILTQPETQLHIAGSGQGIPKV